MRIPPYETEKRGKKRGRIRIGGRTIPEYPKIPRITHLKNGFEKHLNGGEWAVEEKIDGFNTRFFMHDGEVFGATRSGRIDLFLCEKADQLGIRSFLESHPDTIVCGEMLGNTPFTEPVNEGDVVFYCFDIMDENGAFLPVNERRSMIKGRINSVPLLGTAKKYEEFRDIVLYANMRGMEGIVIKSPDGDERIKYVVPNSDVNDIKKTLFKMFDMPSGFFNERIMRMAVFYAEHGVAPEMNFSELFSEFSRFSKELENGRAYEKRAVVLKDPSTWDWMKNNTLKSKEFEIEITGLSKKNGEYRVEFIKKYKKSSRRIRRFLSGAKFTD